MNEKSTIKILALDDEPFMLKLLTHMLSKLGFPQVTTCGSGRAALEWVDSPSCAPDLILCDLNMPEMDGIEFIRKLVEHRYTGSLILVSSEDERVLQSTEKLVQAHQITVLGYLHKPVSPGKLAALLEKYTHLPVQDHKAKTMVYSAEEVRAAIANGELVNYYQPKVAVASGEVVGVETLVRWRHPVDGIVFPDQFISIAEEHGLIDALTCMVLRAALVQTQAWRQAGLVLQVAVNVSMDNLKSLDFPGVVAGLAAEAGVQPEDVVLEVTESRLMRDLRVPLEVLTRLRLKRFHLSIDDFGTEHSSLTRLRDFPFDELKVDRSFVHRAWTDDTLRAIYDASLGLAKQLGMQSVAEGVEDIDDWAFLRRTGCDLAQGYFIAKPMPAADLPGWMKDWGIRVQDQGLARVVSRAEFVIGRPEMGKTKS